MASYITVEQKEAESVKQELIGLKYLNRSYEIIRQDSVVKFPVTTDYKGRHSVSLLDISPIMTRKGFRELLDEFLPDNTVRSYDQVGDIAILEIPAGLESVETRIAECLLLSNPVIKTVLKKSDRHDGVFRTQKMEYLAGIDTRVARFGESGCRFIIDVEQVYFSIRQSTERRRVAQLVKPDERVLVMFSGAAPFPCVLARHSKVKHIDAVELNPVGHQYAEQNVVLNRVSSCVDLYCGDVKEVVPSLKQKYDRIIMPLPKTSEEFLDVAIQSSKNGTVVHLYTFSSAEDFLATSDRIAERCRESGYSYRLLNIVKNGQHAPGIYRICIDFVLENS